MKREKWQQKDEEQIWLETFSNIPTQMQEKKWCMLIKTKIHYLTKNSKYFIGQKRFLDYHLLFF